jgi:hypothetical protein
MRITKVSMPAFQNRTRRVHLVTTPEEYEMAEALAAQQGLTVSELIRLQIQEAYTRAFGAKPASSKKKPKR